MSLPPTDPKPTPTQIKTPLPITTEYPHPLPPPCHITDQPTTQINPHHKPTPPPLPHNPRHHYKEDNVVLEDPRLPLPLPPPPHGVLGLRRGESSCRTKTRERREEKEMKEREERKKIKYYLNL